MDSYLIPRISRLCLKVWRRNWDVFFKTYQVNFLPPFIEPVLYLVAIGFGLGMFVGEINGVPYVNFIAPALLAISMMNAAFFECTYSSYVRMYYQKTFEAMIATPLSIDDVVTGELLWGATRSFIYSTVMLLVLALFGVVDLPLSLFIIPFSFLAGLLFACIAMCFTAITPGIDALNYPSFLFITPMFLFSGTFFPLAILPPAIQTLAVIFLPLTQLVIITRSLTLSSLSPLFLYSLTWIILVTALCFVLSLRLMRKRLIV
jgi:lipooligosaccharide transport system permease protein